MQTPPDAIARHADRHSHISIRLQLQVDGQWEYVEAIGWNAVGFNFYFSRALEAPALEFKRGLLHFEGTLAWSAPHVTDDVVLAAIVNELIYKRAQDVSADATLHTRLLRLIRVPDMVEQKLQILASMGLDIGAARMAQLVAKRRSERPLFQYGVRVQSEAWTAVVDKALTMSEAVVALESWSKSLGPLRK